MGYTTEFRGTLLLDKPLTVEDKEFLIAFNETRRMKRNLQGYGVEGEFYVGSREDFGQNHTPDIMDYNEPPETQPALWCHWVPNESGTGLEWDGGEKAYGMEDWAVYLINRYLEPRGYVLNGLVLAQGEEEDDKWALKVENNVVSTASESAQFWRVVEFPKAPKIKALENPTKLSLPTPEK